MATEQSEIDEIITNLGGLQGRGRPALRLRDYLAANPAMRALDPAKRAAVERFALRLESFQSERILLLAPQFTEANVLGR